MDHLNAILPPPKIESKDDMYCYGFPFRDNVEFYKKTVDPSWAPSQPGVEPNTVIGLEKLKKRTGIKMTLVEVWTNENPEDAVCMLAVASASKEHPESSAQLSEDELAAIVKAAHFEGVEPEWMRSIWLIEDLMEMPYPELV